MFYVYIHTCPNGKKYVGTTVRKPETRWKEGKGYSYNKHFFSAILKYGWENIQHEVFEVGSEKEMYQKEIELIALYHSNDKTRGYNNSTGGEQSNRGIHWSQESRERLSQKTLGRYKGKPKSEEARERMKVANQLKAQDPAFRAKISQGLKGKPKSESHREKLAQLQKDRWSDPEYRERLMSKPRFPKATYRLPDGSIMVMTKANASKHYLKKGIQLEIVENERES